MGVLDRLNIFAIHYFLYNTGITSIFSYTALFATYYTNASTTQFGILRIILPVVTLTTKFFLCPYADRKRCHRSMLIGTLIGLLISNSVMICIALVVSGLPEQESLRLSVWVVFSFTALSFDVTHNVSSVFIDTYAISNAGKSDKGYGRLRIWLAVGSMVGALVMSFVNEAIELPLLVPGLLLFSLLLAVDILALIFWPDKRDFDLRDATTSSGMAQLLENPSPSRKKSEAAPLLEHRAPEEIKLTIAVQWILIKEVARRKTTIYIHCLVITCIGGLQAIQWSYLAVFINETHPSMIFVASGLSILGQSLLSDIPMYFLSKYVINYLGWTRSLTVGLVSIGVKFLLYYVVLSNYSAYYILLIELLNGPGSALFFTTMPELGHYYSDCDEAIMALIKQGIIPDDVDYIKKLRQALKVTTQSLLSICSSALGAGLGTMVGGIIHDNLGFGALWLYSSAFALIVGALNTVVQFCMRA